MCLRQTELGPPASLSVLHCMTWPVCVISWGYLALAVPFCSSRANGVCMNPSSAISNSYANCFSSVHDDAICHVSGCNGQC